MFDGEHFEFYKCYEKKNLHKIKHAVIYNIFYQTLFTRIIIYAEVINSEIVSTTKYKNDCIEVLNTSSLYT